jgi:hypothetical protein
MKKNTHVQGQNALFQFKLKNSTMLGCGEKKYFANYCVFHRYDPLMTFDLKNRSFEKSPLGVLACAQVTNYFNVTCLSF